MNEYSCLSYMLNCRSQSIKSSSSMCANEQTIGAITDLKCFSEWVSDISHVNYSNLDVLHLLIGELHIIYNSIQRFLKRTTSSCINISIVYEKNFNYCI